MLGCILILGAVLRFSQPTLVEFKRDEATIARWGQAIAYEGFLPAVGVDSSLGIDNLPLTPYLMAVALRLWSDPLSAVLFTMLLNTLALPACYALTKEALGRRAALLSTLLFAVSPWAVLYARKIWARTLPIFTLALMASLYLALAKRRRRALVPAFASLAALLGLQLEALAYVPIVGLALLLYRDAVAWRSLLVAVLVAACLLSPYVIHDALNGWENARGLMAYAGGGSSFSWDAVRYAFALLGGKGIEGQAGPFHQDFLGRVLPLWWLNDLLSMLLAGGLVYGSWQAFRAPTEERRRGFGLMLLWFAVPILLQLRTSAPTQQHYFVMHYPVSYMLIAALVVWGWDHLRGRMVEDFGGVRGARGVRTAGWGLLIVCVVACAWQVSVTWRLREMMVAHPTTGGYGIPLRYTRIAAQQAAALADDGEVIVLSEEITPFMAETPTVFNALLFGTPHRFADPRAALPFPERERTVYLAGPLDPQGGVAEMGLSRLGGLPSVSPGPGMTLPDGIAYRTWVWEGLSRDELVAGMTPVGAGVPYANNLVLAAYELSLWAGDEASLEVWLAWWVQELPPAGIEYHFTVQLLDERGGLHSQDDHLGFSAADWATGDIVLSRFVVNLPDDLAPGGYLLRTGIYSYPDIVGVPVVNPEGEPIDDAVTLTTLQVSVDGYALP